MTATDISNLAFGNAGTRWVLAADLKVVIYGHAVIVDLDWWNDSLQARGLSGGPVTGVDEGGAIVESGRGTITRGYIFGLARGASEDAESALRLLWHALAWGSGSSLRDNLLRMSSIAADVTTGSRGLSEAARLARDQPVEAYARLYPGNKTLISSLGPAFLTKYLYFAGEGVPNHPCAILDSRVAASLVQLGWSSLPTRGMWYATAYGRYVNLLQRWSTELGTVSACGPPRIDLFERWLFDHGSSGRRLADSATT